MAESYIWGNLNRAVNDPTLIDEAIGEALEAHNDNPDAHLGPGQALESHRAAEIIDHRAESVVNDKIHSLARSYVALVGTGVEGDFDTIAAAVAYASTIGGGTIFVTAGRHYLAGEIKIPNSINIRGEDADNTVIVGGFNSGNYLRIEDDLTSEHMLQTFENLSFETTGGAIVKTDVGDLAQDSTMLFNYCNFLKGGKYMRLLEGTLKMENCFVECSDVPAIEYNRISQIRDSRFKKISTGAAMYVFGQVGAVDYSHISQLWNCDIDFTGATSGGFCTSNDYPQWSFYFNKITGWLTNGYEIVFFTVFGNEITIPSNRTLLFGSVDQPMNIASNRFVVAGTGKINLEGADSIFNNNYYNGPYSGFTGKPYIGNPMEMGTFFAYNAPGNAVGFRTNKARGLMADMNRTLTTTIAPPGNVCRLYVLTNSTTARTFTFGAGFRAAGTLNTGTTSNRLFIITFQSDGDYMREVSRTGAMVY